MNIVKNLKNIVISGIAVFGLGLALQTPSYGQQQSLEGEWRLVSFNGAFVYRHLDGIKANFRKEKENTFSVDGLAGCSSYLMRDLTTTLDRITFDPRRFFSYKVVNDSRFCLWPTQEKEYLEAIRQVTSYKIGPGTEPIPDTKTIPALELQLIYDENKTLRFIKDERPR